MELGFRLFPGLDRVLEPDVLAQIAAFSLETDGSPPAPGPLHPLHAGDPAGVVSADGLGLEHLHAGALHQRQPLPDRHAAAGLDVTAAQMGRLGHDLPAAVAPAVPRRLIAHIVRRAQDQQLAEPLAGQVHLLAAVPTQLCAPVKGCLCRWGRDRSFHTFPLCLTAVQQKGTSLRRCTHFYV